MPTKPETVHTITFQVDYTDPRSRAGANAIENLRDSVKQDKLLPFSVRPAPNLVTVAPETKNTQ